MRICWSFYSTPEDPLAHNDTMALTTLRDVHLLTVFHYGDWQPVNTYCDGYRLQKFRDGREPCTRGVAGLRLRQRGGNVP
jgi:hypothetical protein